MIYIFRLVDKIDADEVRNVDRDTSFKDIKFKHILLPIGFQVINLKIKFINII